MTNLSNNSTTLTTLDEATNAIGKALATGHLPSLAEAIMDHNGLADVVLRLFLNKLESECAVLSQRSLPLSLFRRIPTDEYATFEWKMLIENLTQKAPTLFHVLFSIVAHSDLRNKKKMDIAHYPGLCMTVAVLLKERNREMCGVQSLISLILYSSHVDKQVLYSPNLLLDINFTQRTYTYTGQNIHGIKIFP